MKWMKNTVDSSERLTECYLDINYPELPKIHQLQLHLIIDHSE